MFRTWLRAHGSTAVTVVSGTAVAALIATVAVVSSGFTAQRVDLGDAAVWVVNQSRQAIGRANTEVLELNTAVEASSARIEVLQDDGDVLLVDHGNSSIELVDPASAAVTETVPLPPGDVDVWLSDKRVTIASGGDVWLVPLAGLDDFDAGGDPTLSLGEDAVATVAESGDLFVVSPDAGEVYRVPPGEETVSHTDDVDLGDDPGDVQITAVGQDWAVLADDVIYTARARVPLPDLSSPVLEEPRGSGSTVLVSHRSGLLRVPLGGGDPRTLVDVGGGAPARPVTVDGCAYGAWADGAIARDCVDEDAVTDAVTVSSGIPALAFAVNGDHVVLNDAAGGQSWAVQRGNELIDNWDDLLDTTDDENQVEENDEDTPPEYEQAQQPPVAVADAFGARPGKATTLPVLLNDFDPNGDVLVVTQLGSIPETVGRLELINSDQQVQVTLDQAAAGEFSFDYTISDGRGGTATASVTVTVRQPGENSAPVQQRQTKATVASAGRLTMQVLGDWVDPDGDPFYLTQASVPAPDQVQFTPDGTVIYTDAGLGGDVKDVGLAVSDGTAVGTGTLAVTVKAPGEVPIVPEPFPVLAYAGEEKLIEPLTHVRGGSGPLRLVNVPAKDGATITPDYDGGTFRFTGSEVRTYYLEYSVTDGTLTATGTIRVEVQAPAEAGSRPVTVPHTAFIEERTSQVVDVLASDFDPAGGVLVVTGAYNVPPESGLRVEVIEQRMLRVTLTRPLEGKPVSFAYRVSNGIAQAEGSVTVIEIAPPPRRQPPVAYPDTASVRVGDAIDIPVLANDKHPNGDALALAPELTDDVPDGAGLLFASGNVLRYLAPDKPGNYTAVYRTVAPDGQWSDAEVRINVREVDVASNAAPVPKTVYARVLSGETVRVSIPLSGIDPDGDSVKLIGQASNPDKGSVVDSGSDYLDYEAGAYSTGTDTFTYTVIDSLGASATGTVRVGISSKLDGSRNPIAVEDEVVVRPGRTVAVQVLLNDSDPDGGALSITSVEPTTEDADAVIDGDVVRVTVPRAEGRYGFIYEISNKWGGTSSNFLTVVARADAPLARPVAKDAVLGLDDILDRETVDVTVLSGVFFADGPVSSLDVAVPAGYGRNATVTDDKQVRVTITDASQIIPFEVIHPDDPSVRALAFIWVPGYDDALPQLKAGIKPIKVVSEETVTIELNDYVVATGGREVRLTDATKVRATHSNGAELVQDSQTLRFTSADRYFGPASISFEVTDGENADDPDGRIATLVLPIDVTPRENQPPVFQGSTIDLEPGQEKTIELVRLTTYPYADDLDELRYSILDPKPTGFTARIDGQKLVITAVDSLRKGQSSTVLIGVRDAINEGTAGRIDLLAVPSTRPLAVPAADNAVVPRGQTTTIDVLANDGPTNPFPSAPLRVVAVRGIDGGNLPAGVTITPNSTNSKLTVAVSADATPADTVLQYQVADATDDPDRYAWGTVRISVQDRPDPPTGITVASIGDREITFSWSPGGFNNSPISGYRVTLVDGGGNTVGTTTCPSTTCRVATPGNGPDNRVRAQVVAVNAIGTSDPAVSASAVWSDVVPAAPVQLAATPLDGGLRVTWAKPQDRSGASPIVAYDVTVGSITETLNVQRNDPPGTTYSRNIANPAAIPNGVPTAYSVTSRNEYYGGGATWNAARGTGVPAGPPIAQGAPAVSPDTDTGTSATVTWNAGLFAPNGQNVSQYFVAIRSGGGLPTCTVDGVANGDPRLNVAPASSTFQHVGGAMSATFTGLSPNTRYEVVVFAYNGQGCTPSAAASATPRQKPGVPSSASFRVVENGPGRYDVRLDDVAWAAGGGTPHVTYTMTVGGASTSGTLPGESGILGTGMYGAPAQVSLQVCESYDDGLSLCSGMSPPFAAGTPVTTVPGQLLYTRSGSGLDTSGTFSWQSAPSGSYTSVEFSCDGSTWTAMPASGTCAASGLVVWPSLQVRVRTADGPPNGYTDSFRANDYDSDPNT